MDPIGIEPWHLGAASLCSSVQDRVASYDAWVEKHSVLEGVRGT
jgi:hypothetical protein